MAYMVTHCHKYAAISAAGGWLKYLLDEDLICMLMGQVGLLVSKMLEMSYFLFWISFMKTVSIQSIQTYDARYKLNAGEGADSIHSDPMYSYAVTILKTDSQHDGVGLALTLGGGNDLVCQAIDSLAQILVGRDIESMMGEFGATYAQIAEHPRYRWLGPHKGVVHLALASITNACFDLWAKARDVPLWKLLIDLTPDEIVQVFYPRYLEDVLTVDDVYTLLNAEQPYRAERENIIQNGYPGYDTSVGWFQYSDEEIKSKAVQSIQRGFDALKLKVGSVDSQRDIRRAHLLREAVGDEVKIMLDVNQQWTLPQAIRLCLELADMDPYWIEEPTHPDDVLAHQTLARAIAPLKLALGEHVPNQIMFKNYLQAGTAGFLQVDCTRVGGISEFIAVSLLARKFGVPVVPHVGDMGQVHQHLVLFNHITMGHDVVFLEHIPHLRDHFVHPAHVEGGVYVTHRCPVAAPI